MKRTLVAAAALAALAPFATALPATADTENCTSRGEYDQLHDFMGLGEVRQLFDISGRDEGDSASGDYYRYSFKLCWTSDERAWLWFSYDGLGLQKWVVR